MYVAIRTVENIVIWIWTRIAHPWTMVFPTVLTTWAWLINICDESKTVVLYEFVAAHCVFTAVWPEHVEDDDDEDYHQQERQGHHHGDDRCVICENNQEQPNKSNNGRKTKTQKDTDTAVSTQR